MFWILAVLSLLSLLLGLLTRKVRSRAAVAPDTSLVDLEGSVVEWEDIDREDIVAGE